ncbi:MAG TPA: peptidoglycan-binding protein [Flavipsychrobacter sp.]|nr:peptidoglycan-binding protein [Flavipsychrobacter sp.]
MPNYTYLRLGDRLPTVGVVQRLLNAHGIVIDVDGVFGRDSVEAVMQFQQMKHIRVTGEVDMHTWALLAYRARLEILDCVDVSFDRTLFPVRRSGETSAHFRHRTEAYHTGAASLARNEYQQLHTIGADVIAIGGTSNGLQVALEEIARRLTPHHVLLRIHGHGIRGMAGISTGEELMGAEGSVFNLENIRANRTLLQQVGDKLYPSGSVQLMHCNVAGGTVGRRLLETMAEMMFVPVSAGINYQLGGGEHTFKFEGPTYTAVPGSDSLRSWSGNLMTAAMGTL